MEEAIFPQIHHTALSEKVYLILRTKILKHELKFGEKIQIDEIASQLGVSRTPVKDAVNRLALEGLVEKVPRRGTFVTTLTLQDVAELLDLRLLLELYAAEKVMEKGKVESLLAEMKKCMSNIYSIANSDDPDYDAYMSWNRDLHLSLIRLADNKRVLQIYKSLNIHLQVARVHYSHSVEDVTQTQQEHQVIYEAFENGNWEQVKKAISTHINNVKTEVLKILKAQVGPSRASVET
jgi:DNA-binding GntR family transcriptional regulator